MAKDFIIYLGENAEIINKESGKSITNGDYVYAIVAEHKDGKVDALKLFKGEQHCKKFDVYEALIEAFEYDCKCIRTCFLSEYDKLRNTFLELIKKQCLDIHEKTEIKKFIYVSYLQAHA